MEKINRIFFHELGHFIAGEINYKYYNGTGTKGIHFYPCKQNINVFCGHRQPNLPKNEVYTRKPPPLVRLAEYLGSLIYGCIFQSYYQNETLRKCFDINGQDDMEHWIGCLLTHELDYFKKDIASIEDEYYMSPKANGELDSFMNLSPENYFVNDGNELYHIDIQKLNNDTIKLADSHYKSYKKLIEKYNDVISKNITNN